MPKKSTLTLLVLGVVASASCNPAEPRVCTLIGCESGLTVELEGQPDASYTITAVAEGGETRTIVCEQAEPCRSFFAGFTPSGVTITYESADRTVERSFTPRYTESRPNGEGCPPVCRNAVAVLQIPDG